MGHESLVKLGPGNLVGSALLLSGIPAEVDASPAGAIRAVRWEAEPLQKYLAANPEVRVIVQQFLAHDLAAKLERSFSTITAADHLRDR